MTSGLPPSVRTRVIALADETLAAMQEDDVPASLRAIRRFTPAKRTRLGAPTIGAALENDPAFRAAVQARVRDGLPDLASAVDAGSEVPAVPAADVAAVAYVLDAPDWRARVEALRLPATAGAGDRETADRRHEKREAARAAAREEAARLRDEVAGLRRELDEVRRALGRAESAVRRSGQSLEEAQARAANVETQKQSLERELSAEVRRLRGRLRDAEASAAAARRGTRSDRDAQGARLRVLLDTVTSAAAGLRRELDLPATIVRPVDLVAEGETVAESSPLGETLAALRRGRAGDDPALVDEILAVPGIHLIIDGYNVTKLGYASLTLEDQRSRLLAGLGALAARSSGVELTCVFDATAAAARPVAAGTPRGVRVLYSALGELADQLIVRLAAAEPQGRPVVVVTNDREVIETVRRSGAEALPSAALLGRLDRG
ncbi:MAG TPA: NYN domain-containing protein [Frankiaceae bacterium]|nr:NYN domain-containing protein [Frankiaceae bacterium]